MNISVLGAGSWGIALGEVLDQNGHNVLLWHRNGEFINKINRDRFHPYFSNYKLSKNLKFTDSLNLISNHAEILISAIPSQSLRSVLLKLPKEKYQIIVSTSKGIENETGMRMSEVISQTLNLENKKIVILSGPSHAEEVIQKYPTAIVSASTSINNAKYIQKLFSNEYFRVYTASDTIGVEIGGSIKNIISIAAGICSGLGYGDNTMAALVTRGSEEIIRLGVAQGAERSTFSGLSGIGDLIVTAFSPHSRNRQVGERIGSGEILSDIINDMQMIAEGVETSRSIISLIEKYQIEMPICKKIYEVLFEGAKPGDAIQDLMKRELVDEHLI